MIEELEKIRKAKKNLDLGDNVENAKRRVTLHNEIFRKFDFTDAIKQDFQEFLERHGDIFQLMEDTKRSRGFQKLRGAPKGNKSQRRQTRILTDLEKTFLVNDPNILDATELKFDTMAQYKSLKRGDIHTHDQITQKALRRRSVRRIVLEDEMTQSELDDQDSSHSSDTNSSFSEESSIDSQASKNAFWRDINTNDDQYKNAVIIKKERGEQYQRQNNIGGKGVQKKRRQNRELSHDYDKITMIKNTLRIGAEKPAYNIGAVENYTQEKINKMQKAHMIEIRNIKNLSIQYAIEYFKEKSIDLNKIFTKEIFEILEQYEQLRTRSLVKEKKMGEMEVTIKKQEKIIHELCTFFYSTLTQVFDKTAKYEDEIDEAFLKLNGKPMTAYAKNDPFQLYTSYLKIYKPKMKEQQEQKYQTKYRLLKKEHKILENSFENLKGMCESYIKEEQIYRQNINSLEYEKQLLRNQFDQKIKELESQVKKHQEEKIDLAKKLIANEARLKAFMQIELQVSESIIKKQQNEFVTVKEELKKIKTIMRIPRLYEKYQTQMKQIKAQEELIKFMQKKEQELSTESKDEDRKRQIMYQRENQKLAQYRLSTEHSSLLNQSVSIQNRSSTRPQTQIMPQRNDRYLKSRNNMNQRERFNNTTQSIEASVRDQKMSIFESMSFDIQPTVDLSSQLNRSVEDIHSTNTKSINQDHHVMIQQNASLKKDNFRPMTTHVGQSRNNNILNFSTQEPLANNSRKDSSGVRYDNVGNDLKPMNRQAKRFACGSLNLSTRYGTGINPSNRNNFFNTTHRGQSTMDDSFSGFNISKNDHQILQKVSMTTRNRYLWTHGIKKEWTTIKFSNNSNTNII